MFPLRSRFLALLFSLLSSLSIAQNYGDCVTAFALCDKALLHFTVAENIGYVVDADRVPCFMNGDQYGQAEKNSTWIYFKIQAEGELVFTISPDSTRDDIDFVLFRLPDDGNCKKKKIVRCMAAGESPDFEKSPCMGRTGLRRKEKDTSEDAGCTDVDDNNWLKPLDAKAGEKYVLLVSNMTAPNGFIIRFMGSALLEPCVTEGENKE